jgi:hypothetical protein
MRCPGRKKKGREFQTQADASSAKFDLSTLDITVDGRRMSDDVG